VRARVVTSSISRRGGQAARLEADSTVDAGRVTLLLVGHPKEGEGVVVAADGGSRVGRDSRSTAAD
jgi:hypothetical protein